MHLIIAILIVAVLLFIYSWYLEPAYLKVSRHTIEVDPAKLTKPLTFLFLSDLHVGLFNNRTIGLAKLRRLRAQLKGSSPDAILLGGDYLDRSPAFLPTLQAQIEVLKQFNCPLIAVLGNHDYASYDDQPELLIKALREWGVTVLRNQEHTLTVDKQSVLIVGLDDLETSRAYSPVRKQYLPFQQYASNAKTLDWYQKFDSVRPELPRIMLAHNPDAVYLPGQVSPTVVIAGHTHGGQMAAIDWFGKYYYPAVPRNSFITWAGRRLINRTTLLVSRGFDGSSFPLRFGRTPEALLVTLKPAQLPKKLVIGLSGKPRSGKDTVAGMLQTLLPGIKIITIGNAVKEEYDRLHGTNTLHSETEKIKHRDGLNQLGSERRAEDRDYWVKKTVNHEPPLMITDVRWPHEAEVVHAAHGFLIRVEVAKEVLRKRMGEDFHKHIDDQFESQLDAYNKWDYVIDNNGTLLDLERQVQQIYREIMKKQGN